METHLVDGSSDTLFSNLATSALDVAFIADSDPHYWDGKSVSVWSERVVVALPEDHPLSRRGAIRWNDLKHESLLLPQRGPGPEFLKLLASKMGELEPDQLVRHDAALDRLLTLVGLGSGLMLALEGATGMVHPGILFREVHNAEEATRLNFRAYWRAANDNPTLRPFLDMLRERYPDLSGDLAPG